VRNYFATVICLLALSHAANAQEFKAPPWFSASRCTRDKSEAADRDLDGLLDWAAVYRTFKLYKQCDDGGTAEGYSDAVAILLTKHWSSVGVLARLARSNPEFGDFVLLHVDSLMSPDQARTIASNAEKHCPVGAKEMCKRLGAKAGNPG
jgi:hypothetical protein